MQWLADLERLDAPWVELIGGSDPERAPVPSREYASAIGDYISNRTPLDEFAGFKVLARQIHPHTGGGMLLIEADNMTAVQKQTYPEPGISASRRRLSLALAMRSLLNWREV